MKTNKLKDGTTKPFEPGDKVVYIPKHLLIGNKRDMIKAKNIGKVTSKNEHYVFVQYRGCLQSQATRVQDLYFLHNRPDLEKLINDDKTQKTP